MHTMHACMHACMHARKVSMHAQYVALSLSAKLRVCTKMITVQVCTKMITVMRPGTTRLQHKVPKTTCASTVFPPKCCEDSNNLALPLGQSSFYGQNILHTPCPPHRLPNSECHKSDIVVCIGRHKPLPFAGTDVELTSNAALRPPWRVSSNCSLSCAQRAEAMVTRTFPHV